MLADSQVATRLPAKDLERAKRFYSEKLGLQPVEERPGGLCYRCRYRLLRPVRVRGSRVGQITRRWPGRSPTSRRLSRR